MSSLGLTDCWPHIDFTLSCCLEDSGEWGKRNQDRREQKEPPKDFSFLPVKNILAANKTKMLHRDTKIFLLHVSEKPSRPNQHTSRKVSFSHFFLAKKLVKLLALLVTSLGGRPWMKGRKCGCCGLDYKGIPPGPGLPASLSTGRNRAPSCGEMVQARLVQGFGPEMWSL